MQRLAMINKDRGNFQYKGGDLVYIISPLTSQLRTNSQKIAIKHVGTSGSLQNHRPPQLFIDDTGWNNTERNL